MNMYIQEKLIMLLFGKSLKSITHVIHILLWSGVYTEVRGHDVIQMSMRTTSTAECGDLIVRVSRNMGQ